MILIRNPVGALLSNYMPIRNDNNSNNGNFFNMSEKTIVYQWLVLSVRILWNEKVQCSAIMPSALSSSWGRKVPSSTVRSMDFFLTPLVVGIMLYTSLGAEEMGGYFAITGTFLAQSQLPSVSILASPWGVLSLPHGAEAASSFSPLSIATSKDSGLDLSKVWSSKM